MIMVTEQFPSERMQKMYRKIKLKVLTPEELAQMRRKKKPESVPQRGGEIFRSAEWYARASVLLCLHSQCRPCGECPLGMNKDESGNLIPCTTFQRMYPAEAVNRVEMWWNEYTRKTERRE